MIKINGKEYKGNNVVVQNNRVIIDGEDVTPKEKEINISVEGNIETLKVDEANQITVNGEVGTLDSINGKVKCGNVKGHVATVNGDVEAGYVEGGVSTVNGDVEAEVIHGTTKTTNGDIKN
jgi:hypothetical protein